MEEESIFKLIPDEPEASKNGSPLSKTKSLKNASSRLNDTSPSVQKKAAASMGPSGTVRSDPKKFLKKGEKTATIPKGNN